MQITDNKKLVGASLERERLHPYTLGSVSEDKYHDKKQIYTRIKDPDCTGSIRANTSAAELCRKHNVHPQTFHNWKQSFMEFGKAGLSQSGKKYPIKTMEKRDEGYKRLIGRLTIDNDILKKIGRKTEIECSCTTA